VKVIIFIETGNLQKKWDDCSENEKKDIGLTLNKQGLNALGYVSKKK